MPVGSNSSAETFNYLALTADFYIAQLNCNLVSYLNISFFGQYKKRLHELQQKRFCEEKLIFTLSNAHDKIQTLTIWLLNVHNLKRGYFLFNYVLPRNHSRYIVVTINIHTSLKDHPVCQH